MSAEQHEAFFREADRDGSGRMSFSELAKMLRSKGYVGNDSQLKSYFSSTDIDGDGEVTLDEYMTAMGHRPAKDHKQAAMRRVFRDFDKDGSGSIDKGELKQVFSEMGKHFSDAELARMVALSDDDNSQSIDYEEFIKHVF